MTITVKEPNELRSKLKELQEQHAGKKVWLYLHDDIAFALSKKHAHGNGNENNLYTFYMMETDEYPYTVIHIALGNRTQYSRVIEIQTLDDKFDKTFCDFSEEPDEIIFIRLAK